MPMATVRASRVLSAALFTALATFASGTAYGAPGPIPSDSESATGSEGSSLLPATPSPGLQVTVSVSCDFEDHWWEASLHAGADLPLELRSHSPGMFRARDRQSRQRLDPDERAELYRLARAAFDGFRIDRRPDFSGAGSGRPWTGERTITLSAMTLDDELGRVDRVELAIDVMRGRSLPPAALALVDAITAQQASASLELDCR